MKKNLNRSLGRLSALALVAASWLSGPAALAQDLGLKAPAPTKPVWITGGTVHTMADGAAPIERGAVEILVDGTIGRVINSAPPSADASTHTMIDAAGKHVYPGMLAPTTQIGLTEIQAARATNDFAETGDVAPEVRPAVAVNPDSTIIPVTRTNGVLSAGVMPLGGLIPGRASVIELEGWTWEQMAVRDAIGMVVNWPNMRTNRAWWVTETPEKQAERRKKSLDTIDHAFRTAKAYLAARATDASTPTDLRWEAMRGVLEKGEPVFIRAEELEQIQSAVSWAVGLGLRPVIVGGRDAASCTDLLKRHDVAVIITGTQRFPKREDSAYDEAFTLPQALENAGVRWCLANGGPTDDPAHERNYAYHAAMAAAYGLSPAAAERSITISPARIMGVGDKLGSLEPGKHATLMITTGSPLEITTNVERAFIRGREIDLSNKQTVLDKKYREKYRQLEAESGGAKPAGGGGSNQTGAPSPR